jgi:hypothetical protein
MAILRKKNMQAKYRRKNAKKQPKHGYPRPNGKITNTHKKQENNLVKRIKMLTIGRGGGYALIR